MARADPHASRSCRLPAWRPLSRAGLPATLPNAMPRSYCVIDAFATGPFTGNPAAVVLDADGLTGEQMQQIAAEFNLSETTFVLPIEEGGPSGDSGGEAVPGLSVRFRWFTPTTEVDMCGHATVAGVHALAESGRLVLGNDAESVAMRIETKSGRLTAFLERIPGGGPGRMIWVALREPTLTPHPVDHTALGTVLRLTPDVFVDSPAPAKTQDRDLLVLVRDFQALNAARPDFPELAVFLERGGLRGLCLATASTLTPSINVQSRFFAPTTGVNEDPVTGSVHGPLAVYLVVHDLVPVHDGVAGLTCTQAKPGGRAGLLYALVERKEAGRYAARIGGRAVTTMRGMLLM